MSNLVDEVNKEMADTMKRIPGNLLRLIRTIQQIQEWNERHRNTAWKDEFKEIKNKLSETEKEYEDIYNKIYESKDFEILLPQTYEEMEEGFANNGYIEDRINEQADYYERENGEIDISDLDYDPYDEFKAGTLELPEIEYDMTQNDDWKQLCSKYFSEEYEGDFETEFIDLNGNFNFNKFEMETEFYDDIIKPMAEQILTGEKVTQAVENVKKEIIEWQKEKQEKTNSAPSFDDDWER